MANIHGMNDYRNEDAGQGRQQQGFGQGMGGMGGMAGNEPLTESAQKALAMYTSSGLCNQMENMRPREGKNARQENFWDMWKFTFCPKLSLMSFSFFMVILQTFVWILTLTFTGINYNLNSLVFLGPALDVLNKWGACNPYQIQQNYQIWRIFTPLVLSNGFSSLMITLIVTMLFGSLIESAGMSTQKVALLYIVSGSGGYLFKSACNGTLSVGGLPGCFGFLAAMTSNIILNWTAIQQLGGCRFCLVVMMLLVMGLVIMVTYTPPITVGFERNDMAAEGGAYIIGLFLSLVLLPAARPEATQPGSIEKKMRMVGWAGILIFFAIVIPILFTQDPKYHWRFGE